MPVIICPRCQQRIIVEKHSEDVNHICNSRNTTLDQEDVVVVGNWEDYTGSGKGLNPMTQGTENTLFGARADIEGEREQNKTLRGVRSSTRRQRQHIQYIDLQGGGC